MTNDIDIKLVGDQELMKVLTNLEYKTQHKVLKRVVGDAAQKTMVGPIRSVTPVRSGTLKSSVGKKAGKSKRSAVVFAGPLMGGKHKGYVANILEHGKGTKRTPKNSKALSTPWGPRMSVAGIKAKPFVRPTILANLKNAENHIFKSIRTIMEREMKKARKTGRV